MKVRVMPKSKALTLALMSVVGLRRVEARGLELMLPGSSKDDIARMEAIISRPQFQEQAQHVAQQMVSMVVDPHFQEQVKQFAVSAKAPENGEQMETLLSDPRTRERAKLIAEQMEAMVDNASWQGSAAKALIKDSIVDRLADGLSSRALPHIRSPHDADLGLESAMLRKGASHVASQRKIVSDERAGPNDYSTKDDVEQMLDRALLSPSNHLDDLDNATLGFMGKLHPAVKGGLTSGAIMTVADIIAQNIERKVLGATKENPRNYNPSRTAKFSIVGLTWHGPYFQQGFAWVDRLFGPSLANGKPLWGIVAKKIATTQFVLNPPFMVVLFAWIGVLEGKREPQAIVDNVVAKWPAAFWAGNMFWPVANFVNFRFLGPEYRVAYVAACGAVWNTFISLLNQYKDEEMANKKQQAVLGTGSKRR